MNKKAKHNYSLTPEEGLEYRKKGFILCTGYFMQNETKKWQNECERLWQQAALDSDDPSILYRGHLSKGRIADRFDPVIDRSPLFKHLVQDERILKPVQNILNSEVILLKDKLITKRPGTKGYGMHQDYPFWKFVEVPSEHIISVQVSIDAAGPENGALELFPGLHSKQLPAPADYPFDADEKKIDLSLGRILKTQPGDLHIFSSLTPHRSGTNQSNNFRRTLYLTYVPAKYRSAREDYYEQISESQNHHIKRYSGHL